MPKQPDNVVKCYWCRSTDGTTDSFLGCLECQKKRDANIPLGDGIKMGDYNLRQLDSYGGEYSGYNMGLDQVVRNRGEWKQAAKNKGLRHVE